MDDKANNIIALPAMPLFARLIIFRAINNFQINCNDFATAPQTSVGAARVDKEDILQPHNY